jgi:hypothetical protein
MVLAPLMWASYTRPKQSISYYSKWTIFYCSVLGVAFVHTPAFVIVCNM